MKKIAKRALSGLLAVIMVVSLLCVGAQAETITEKSSDNSTSLNAQSINLGDEINGKISGKGDVDFYKFTLTEEGCVTFKITSYMEYYSLIIYDSSGDEVWSSLSNVYNSVVGFITNTHSIDLTNGVYFLKVDGEYHTYYHRYSTGNYTIQTSFTSANANETESNNSAASANPITLNSEIRGQIASNDSEDFFSFTLTESHSISLNITSYMQWYSLFLYTKDGSEVWSSHSNEYDSAVGYIKNTHTFEIDAGQYYLKVDGQYHIYYHRYSTGTYTLQLNINCASDADHIWNGGEVTTQPTTSTTGIKTYTCTVCGETKTEEIAKLPASDTNSSATTTFTDVPSSQYYYDPVYWAVGKGITNGTGGSSFSPNANCTRGQIVTFLWRAAGEPEPTTTVNPFTDVSEKDYYYKAVLWAYENGITTGATATTFNPKGNCTRGQIVTFLWRYANKPTANASGAFSDVKTGEYYTSAVYWAVANGITNGMSTTTFVPGGTCTRGQAVTFLYRYAK